MYMWTINALRINIKHCTTVTYLDLESVSAIWINFVGDEQFKLVNTRDENLSDSINERQSIGNMGGYTIEPRLNLVD